MNEDQEQQNISEQKVQEQTPTEGINQEPTNSGLIVGIVTLIILIVGAYFLFLYNNVPDQQGDWELTLDNQVSGEVIFSGTFNGSAETDCGKGGLCTFDVGGREVIWAEDNHTEPLGIIYESVNVGDEVEVYGKVDGRYVTLYGNKKYYIKGINDQTLNVSKEGVLSTDESNIEESKFKKYTNSEFDFSLSYLKGFRVEKYWRWGDFDVHFITEEQPGANFHVVVESVNGNLCFQTLCNEPSKNTTLINGSYWEYLGPQTYCDAGNCSYQRYVYRSVYNNNRFYVLVEKEASERDVMMSFKFADSVSDDKNLSQVHYPLNLVGKAYFAHDYFVGLSLSWDEVPDAEYYKVQQGRLDANGWANVVKEVGSLSSGSGLHQNAGVNKGVCYLRIGIVEAYDKWDNLLSSDSATICEIGYKVVPQELLQEND